MIDNPRTADKKKSTDEPRRQARHVILDHIVQRAESLLWSAAGDDARDYLHQRDFTDDDLRSLRVGLFDDAADMVNHVVAQGIDRADVWAQGVLVNRNGHNFDGYIIFPWADDFRRWLTLYAKCIGKDPPTDKAKTYALPNPKIDGKEWLHTKCSPYLLDRALAADHRQIVLVEGVTDAALLQVRGDTRVVACVAAQLSKDQGETLARHHIESVIIALDPDQSGEQGITSCVKTLVVHGITPLIAPRLPDKLDPDEFLAARGVEAWREHVAQAHPAAEALIKHAKRNGTHRSTKEWEEIPKGKNKGDRYPSLQAYIGKRLQGLADDCLHDSGQLALIRTDAYDIADKCNPPKEHGAVDSLLTGLLRLETNKRDKNRQANLDRFAAHPSAISNHETNGQAASPRPNLASARHVEAVVREIPRFTPFPMACLPHPLRAFVEEGAIALGADPSYLALPILATVAGAIGNSRVLQLKDGWTEPSIIWAAVVGDSGTLKSPAWHMAVKPLHYRQKAEVDAYETALKVFLEKFADWEKEKQKKNGNPGQKPEKPILRHIYVSDLTIEKLGEVLTDCPRGVFLGRDELAAWLASFTRYKGRGSGSDLHHWLEAFHARPLKIDRKTGERRTLFVQRVAVSLAGGVTPGTLARAITGEFLEAGLAARMLMAMPPKKPVHWSDLVVDPNTLNAYDQLIGQLLDLNADVDKDGNLRPVVVHLQPRALDRFKEFVNRWGREQASVEGEVAAAYSKLVAYCARFALLFHIVETVSTGPHFEDVAPEAIERGAALAWWFGNESSRIYSMLGESGIQRDTRRLIEFIRTKNGRVTANILQRANGKKWPTSQEADNALQELVAAGLGEWQQQPAGPQGGRPTRWFVLKPPDETDETRLPGDDSDTDQQDYPTKPHGDSEFPVSEEVSSV